MDFLIASGIFAVVFVLSLVLFTSRSTQADESRELMKRMARPLDEIDVSVLRRRRADGGFVSAAIRQVNLIRRLEEMMWQAGIYTRVSDVLVIILLLFGAGFAGTQAFWGDFFVSILGGAALGAIPVGYIELRRRRRLRAFALQLPFALDLIKSSLEAGHSLQRALQVVVGEFADPLGSEFRTVLEQNRIGLPLGRALEDMLKRVPEDDLRLLVVAVKVQSEVGSSLAQIVGRLSEIVRIRQRLRLQVRALTAQARLGGWVVGFLPVAVLVFFALLQPGYVDELFYDPAGQRILKIAIGLDLAAIVTIRRLLRVSY
jgi:tight adherence protein B